MMSSIRKIYGRRTVLEAIRSKDAQIERLVLAKGAHGSILKELANEAEARNITVEWMEKRRLDKLFGQSVNQGVVAILKAHKFIDVHDLITKAKAYGGRPLIVIADEIEDPRNLGAICRCAEGSGAQGLIITYHRSADITAVAAKTSGGAVEHLPISQVKNLAQTIEILKKHDFWIAGLDAKEAQNIWETDLNRPLALVIGSEGKGLRRLTRDNCDFLIKIPMLGQINSLNAAVAAGIALFEIRRQQDN
jgi:23S rRNA (guanosine2251-2'-O)-methyltransferase